MYFDQQAVKSKRSSNDQELIQSDPTSCPQNQKGKLGAGLIGANKSDQAGGQAQKDRGRKPRGKTPD